MFRNSRGQAIHNGNENGLVRYSWRRVEDDDGGSRVCRR